MKDNKYFELINFFRDETRANSIIRDLGSDYSKTPNAQELNKDISKKIFGASSYKVLTSANLTNSKLIDIDLNKVVTLGGWCVLRTKDMQNLRKGLITDPINGELKRFNRVSQLSKWIRDTQSFDQITDAVLPNNISDYIIVSERRLWSDKIINALEVLFDRSLTIKENNEIYQAVRESEEKKLIYTEKYLRKFNNKSARVTRFIDEDQYDNLIRRRDEIFNKFEIDRVKLINPLLSRKIAKHLSLDVAREKEILVKYVNEYSLSWYFFTGDYFDNILKKFGYTNKSVGLIPNPWSYALGKESEPEKEFNKKVFSGKNEYLKKDSINNSVTFIPIAQAETYSFKPYRSHRSIELLPNSINFKRYLANYSHSIEEIQSLYLRQNNALIDAFNFFNEQKVIESLINITKESNKFSSAKSNFNKNSLITKKDFSINLRQTGLQKIKPDLQMVNDYMHELLNSVFN